MPYTHSDLKAETGEGRGADEAKLAGDQMSPSPILPSFLPHSLRVKGGWEPKAFHIVNGGERKGIEKRRERGERASKWARTQKHEPRAKAKQFYNRSWRDLKIWVVHLMCFIDLEPKKWKSIDELVSWWEFDFSVRFYDLRHDLTLCQPVPYLIIQFGSMARRPFIVSITIDCGKWS